MAIRFPCPSCGKTFKAGDSQAGARFRCKACGTISRVPAESQATDSATTADTTSAAPSSTATSSQPETSTSESSTAAADLDLLGVGSGGMDDVVQFKRRSEEDDGLDMTPMVDVTFLLLIFFMITASFSLQKSIDMPVPDRESTVAQSRTIEEIEQDDDYIIVAIDKDSLVWVNDREAPTRQELLSQLRTARTEGTQTPNSMLVLASGDARHETVVMVLDAGTAVGMENIRLSKDEGL